jgi:2-amino-4-hydroxy-6-hydroxymethyldihydropteridine diphosphokinase
LPVTAYIAFGANLGDPGAVLPQAMDDLAQTQGVTLVCRSSLYRTAPVASSGPDYINAVVEVSTVLTAPDLWAAMQNIESKAGRARPYLNAPRTLDLDLLLYGTASIQSDALEVPHPRMGERAFVLVPLAEIAPELVSTTQMTSVLGQTISPYLQVKPDSGD